MSDRPKRQSVGYQVKTFLSTHKILVAAFALVSMGAGGAMYMSRFATHEDLERRHVNDSAWRKQIQALKENDAEFRSTLRAIQKSSNETRDDMKIILQHVLENPRKDR